MSIKYENAAERQADGKPCDAWWFGQQCDVYLIICVRTSPKGNCNLLEKRTPTYWNSGDISFPELLIDVRDISSETFYITIEAWDYDNISSDDLIALFDNEGYEFEKVEQEPTVIPMIRSDLQDNNEVSLRVTMRKV